jgi:hypothetical protein
MNKIWVVLVLIFTCSCDSQSNKKSTDFSSMKSGDSIKSYKNASGKKPVDSLPDTFSPDSADLPPSQTEEREKLKTKYNETKIIDSAIITNNLDTLHLFLKYYCLKNVDLVVPPNYDLDHKLPTEFVTHPFVTYVRLIHNRDTVLSRTFQASDFNPYFADKFGGNLKKSGSILMLPDFFKGNKDKNQIVLIYSIAIPATDIGIGMFFTLSKDGRFKITENE